MSDVVGFMRETFDARSESSEAYTCWFCYDRPRWDYFDEAGCVLISTNALGLRDQEIGPKMPDELRMLAIGDSFTFGFGVLREDTWPQVLERRLAERVERPVQVVNCGFADGAHEPRGYADWLVDEGLALEPDTVLFGICLNDIHRNVPMAVLPPRDVKPWLGGASRLLDAVQGMLVRREYEERVAKIPERKLEQAQRNYLTEDGAWEAAQAALLETRDRLAALDVRFVVVVFPMLTRLTTRYPFPLLHEAVREFCDASGIECIDLLDPVLEHVRAIPGFRDDDAWVHALGALQGKKGKENKSKWSLGSDPVGPPG